MPDTAEDGVATRKRIPQEERRTQIIEAAIHLFANKGFKGTTTREIACAAGISEAIIFRHFATKEDLYDAIIAHTLERRFRVWEQEEGLLQPPADLETALRTFAHAYIRRSRQDPAFIRLMLYSALEDHKFRERFLEVYRSPYLAAICRTLEEGVRQEAYRPVNPRLTFRAFLWALLHYCVSRFVAHTQDPELADERAVVDNLVNVFMRGLLPPEKQP